MCLHPVELVFHRTHVRKMVSYSNAASAEPLFYGLRVLRGEAQESAQLTNAPGASGAQPSLETTAFS